ncbi:MAG TPA: cobalamin-binding protein [Acidobacteriota bacterium]|nr:cobalamin-binding protein [Acidobacteriota bacterium]
MRIVSLLPSATEIVCRLGLIDQLFGVTHECDYPPEIRSKVVLTRCAFDSRKMSPAQIDAEVRRLAREEKSLYEIDEGKLAEIAPDLIVTQDLCHVCAITPREVDRAAANLPNKPNIISLNPARLQDVLDDMIMVGKAAGRDASPIVAQLQARVRRVAETNRPGKRPTVGCIEWLEPLWRSGHWIPEMVQLAGGTEVLAETGKPSRSLTWDELAQRDPDFVLILPCGYDLEKTRISFEQSIPKYPWQQLKAWREGKVFLTDANSYFSRSGPRLVHGLELIAEILYPEYVTVSAPADSYLNVSSGAHASSK